MCEDDVATKGYTWRVGGFWRWKVGVGWVDCGIKAIGKVVLEHRNTMKDIFDPSSVGFRPRHASLLSISCIISVVDVGMPSTGT